MTSYGNPSAHISPKRPKYENSNEPFHPLPISSTIRPYHLTQKPPKISKNHPFHPLVPPFHSAQKPPKYSKNHQKPPKYSKNHPFHPLEPFHSTQKPYYKPPNLPKPNFVHTKPHGQPIHSHLGLNQFQRNQKSVQGRKMDQKRIKINSFLTFSDFFMNI